MSDITSCLCPECTGPCWHFPGWFIPEEAEKAIDAGLADRLMLDYYINDAWEDEEFTYVLSPASVGHEKKYAPDIEEMARNGLSKGRCTFLNKRTKKCGIHDTDYKPHQCKELVACSDPPKSSPNYELKPFWDTEKGRKVIERWKQEVDTEFA